MGHVHQSAFVGDHRDIMAGEKDVLGHAHGWDQAQLLLGDRDAGLLGSCRVGKMDGRTIEAIFAAIAAIEAADDLDQRRLASAVLANQPHHLAGQDLESRQS